MQYLKGSIMRIKDGFIKKPILDDIVVVATGEAGKDFEGLVRLNETASFIWDEVTEGKEIDQITKDMCQRYEVSEDQAKNDALSIISKMKEQGFFVDENDCGSK